MRVLKFCFDIGFWGPDFFNGFHSFTPCKAHFNGSDVDGRSTCAGGICPAGSEEQDGTCRPCDEGSFSLAGGPCTKCGSGKYSLAASSSCLECEPGKVSETSGASKCDACPAGKYEIDHQSCSNCPAGFISSRGNSSCTKCPAGFIAPTTGSSTCAQCPGGTFAPPGSSECQKCLRGTYSLSGSGRCLHCLAGTVSMVDGASTCNLCPAGREGLNGQSCSPCRSGFFSPSINSSCMKCPAGFKAPKAGSIACEPCPGGFYSEGAPTCIQCPVGRISSGAGGKCRQCDAGSFAKDSTCELCPSGTFAPPGSSECQKCLRGTYSLSGSGRCLHCLAGTVSMVDGASTCHLCPPGTEESKRQSCSPCRSGFISSGGNSSCMKCQAGFNAPKTGSSACEPCPGGFYSEEGAPTCIQCPVGTISGAASGSCDSCEGNFLRAVPDATKQSCEVDSIQMLLLAASALASTGFCFLCLTGFLGNATIADVSAQGQKVVMTTTLSHFLLKRSQVTFTGTGNPNLEGQSWTVQALNSFQLTLQVEGSDLDQLDTSMGRLHIKCPGPFIHTGLWRCPLIFWCLLFGAASACAMSQLTWFLRLLMASFGVFAGSLAFTWRFRWGLALVTVVVCRGFGRKFNHVKAIPSCMCLLKQKQSTVAFLQAHPMQKYQWGMMFLDVCEPCRQARSANSALQTPTAVSQGVAAPPPALWTRSKAIHDSGAIAGLCAVSGIKRFSCGGVLIAEWTPAVFTILFSWPPRSVLSSVWKVYSCPLWRHYLEL